MYPNWISRIIIVLFVFFIIATGLYAQPANDNCANASLITIGSSGFGYGSFKSANSDLTSATVQNGETFAPAIFAAGEDQKSVWYKFTLPTTRSVRVNLFQPGTAIPAADAGFAVYKTGNCLPGLPEQSTKFTPISRFSSSYNPCVDAGDYLVQVSSKSGTSGTIYIQLDVSDSTDADYDHPKDAYDLGVISSRVFSDFDVQCQSIEDAAETCPALANAQLYTKSTWHTFTTPAYFDYVTVMLSSANCNFANGNQTFGYTLYKGDVKKTDYKALTQVSACDSLVTTGYNAGYKIYKCSNLQPNTTYSIQVFYKEDFVDKVRVNVGASGISATQAPEPVLSKLPASNKLGKLPGNNGESTYATDYFGCNSQHILHACSPSLPAKGITVNNTRYDLSTFYTFELTSSANITISSGTNTCGYPLLLRLYNQNLTATCSDLDTANVIEQNQYNFSTGCLPAGIYTLQISGSDSILGISYFYCNSSSDCQLTNLGQQINTNIRVTYVNAANVFSLKTNGDYDPINVSGGVMKPLQNGIVYQAEADTFGCNNTVMPPKAAGQYCNANAHKAMYREFVIGDADGDNKPDSGILEIKGYYNSGGSTSFNTIIYKGDANTLAAAQSAHAEGDTVKNLIPVTECLLYQSCNGTDFCITPGTYTAVTIGDDNHVGIGNRPSVGLYMVKTEHYDGATAQNMGSILDTLGENGGTVYSDIDHFSCTDNAVTINGIVPPDIYSKPATKAIYRQFYLKSPAVTNICWVYSGDCYAYNGPAILFAGKASDGLNKLTFVQSTTNLYSCMNRSSCDPLPAGWYTVVCYASGPTYDKPFQSINEDGGYGSSIGHFNQFSINVTIACPGPQYNHPRKAAIDTTTKQPFLLEWKPRSGSTAAYPVMDTTYTLPQENFNCTVDTPFTIVKPCNDNVNRVVYYVFKIQKESYIQINTQNLWGEVFAGDVRTDSTSFKTATPIQPCLQSSGYIQLCRLQPGTYTLVEFAGDNNVSNGCGSTQPTIYIDAVGYSRFDHAKNAYDFGTIPADSVYYNGKPGDMNPLNTDRAASNDFFYCTTGSQKIDPVESACSVDYNPNVYNTNPNNHFYDSSFLPMPWNVSRRNLWYTFVVDKPGNVHVKVTNPTSSGIHYPFAVYKSDVDGTLPFTTIVSSGKVDSTVEQGLSIVDYNLRHGSYYCYTAPEEITFYRDPCQPDGPTRYYIVVDDVNSIPYDYPGLKPNSQAEVSVMLDTVNAIATKFDHYSTASDIGSIGIGKLKAASDNFTCATADATDPTSSYSFCAKKTLWYKFTSTVTGHVKYRMYVDSVLQSFTSSDIQLFKQITPGDSTSEGLSYINPGYVYDTDNTAWGLTCVSPGTYYLLITGCSRGNENEFPEIEIEEEAGDFCSSPVVASINGVGADTASVMIDCHTIGTDYGEFAEQLSCPENADTKDYKSSWFRMDIGGKDTLDVSVHLDEYTTATNDQIKYRKMTGDCNAMQEESCVKDTKTVNTYRCLVPGRSYYIQVFTPVFYNGYSQTTGTIDLIVSSVKHTDTCAPDANCLAIAKFIPQFDCTTDDSVNFVNYSTYGSGIQYKWDFGYNNQTSTDVSPSFFYPALATDKKYNIKLSLLNKSCNGKDSVTVPLTVPARPHVDLGSDITACNSDTSITLHATSFDGATYAWNYGSTDSVYTIPYHDQHQYSVEVTFKGCISRDTINVFINPVPKQETQNTVVCPADSVQLTPGYYSAPYLWNTGETQYYIYAKDPGIYWTDITYGACTIRDSFTVGGVGNTKLLGNDTTICFSNGSSYTLDATSAGVSSYQWQDGNGNAQYTVSQSGTYWVDVRFSACTVRDSIVISQGTPPVVSITGTPNFCSGDSSLLDAGKTYASYLWSNGDTSKTTYIKASGDYTITVTDSTGCIATSPAVTVTQNDSPQPQITGSASLCGVSSVSLSVDQTYSSYLWSTGETTKSIIVNKADTVSVKVTDNNGCSGSDSLVVASGTTSLSDSLSATICSGGSYIFPSGKEANTTGFHSDTIKTTTGCDSLITTVNLAVLSPVRSSLSASVCTGSFYTLPSGKQVSEANTYIDTVKSTAGCDSLITTITLSVGTPVVNNIAATICKGNIYTLPDGNEVSEANTYSDTLRSAMGCDSLIRNITLSVLSLQAKEITAAICSGQSYAAPSGKTFDAAGDNNDTLRSVSGCDSLITTIHLSIISPETTSLAATICNGQSYTLPSGKRVTQEDVYTDTLKSSLGCDSLVTQLSLTVKEATRQSASASLCKGQVYVLPSGKEAARTGTYSDTLTSVLGCDSLITTLSLSVLSSATSAFSASLCEGQFYTLPSGKQVSAAGVYPDTLRNASGCDSLIQTITVKVLSPLNVSLSAAVCADEMYILPSGKEISRTGIYIDTLRSISGCDSLITTVDLSVASPAGFSDITAAICNGASYVLPSGKKVNRAGNYTDTLHSSIGCDSLITRLSLATITAIKNSSSAKICSGGSYLLPWGTTASTAGIYSDTLRSAGSCDSIITSITLSLFSPVRKNSAAAICAGQVYTLPSGRRVSATGIYSDTLRSIAGCDSIINTVMLSVAAAAIRQTATASICEGESFRLPSGNTVSDAGTYPDTLRSKGGCDSLITVVTLSVKPKPVITIQPASAAICEGDSVLLSASGGDQYTWSPSAGLSSVDAATTWAYPAATATYQVTATTQNCSSSSPVMVIVNTSPAIVLSKSNDISCLYSEAHLSVSGAATYAWSPVDSTIINANSYNPVVMPAVTTMYHVLATSQYGCTAEGTIEVKVLQGSQGNFDLPSAFTPNHDGFNDCFGVKSWGMVSNLHFQVFDRTGRLLFSTTNSSQCWDGTWNGQLMQAGTYVYQASADTNCGFVYRKNTVVLIR